VIGQRRLRLRCYLTTLPDASSLWIVLTFCSLAAMLPLTDPLLFAYFQVHQIASRTLRDPTAATSVVPCRHDSGIPEGEERRQDEQLHFILSPFLIKRITVYTCVTLFYGTAPHVSARQTRSPAVPSRVAYTGCPKNRDEYFWT